MAKHLESQHNKDCFGQFSHGFCPAEEVCHFRQKPTDCMLQCQVGMGFQRNVQVCGLERGKQTFDMASSVSQVQTYVFYICRIVQICGCMCVDDTCISWCVLMFLCSSFRIPRMLCRLVGAGMRTSVPVKLSSICMRNVKGSL